MIQLDKIQKKEPINFFRLVYSSLLCLLLIPFIFMFAQIIGNLKDSSSILSEVISIRKMGIAFKTINFSLIVSLVSVCIGFLIAFAMHRIVRKKWIAFILLACLMMVPSYIHGFLWMKAGFVFWGKVAMSGFGISVVSQSAYYLPMSISFWLVFFQQIHKEYYFEAQLNTTIEKSYMNVLLQLGRGVGSIIGSIIFLLCLTDYTIPSIFVFNTYPIEIMSIFASYYELTVPVIASIPMAMITLLMVLIMILVVKPDRFQLDTQLFETEQDKVSHSKFRKIYCILLVFVSSIYLLIPLFLFGYDTKSSVEAMQSLGVFASDGIFSLVSAGVASVLIVAIALAFNYYRYRYNKKTSGLIVGIISLFGISGTIIGLFVNGFYQGLISLFPILEGINFTMIPMIHVFVLRFLPIGFFILYFGFLQLDKSLINVALLNTHKHRVLFYHCVWQRIKSYVYIALFSCFMFSFGELSGAMMVVPPGRSTLSVSIYNYLHYGSTELVSALCVLVVLITFCIGVIGGLVVTKIVLLEK